MSGTDRGATEGSLKGGWTPAMAAFVASAESDEFRSMAGLAWSDPVDGHFEQSMTLSAGMCEADGSGAAGVLGVLADSTLGTAAAAARNGTDGIVTLGLHVDLPGALPRVGSTISMRTERVVADGEQVWVEAKVTDAAHTIAWVTWRGLFVDFVDHHARLRGEAKRVPVEMTPVPALGRSVDETFGVVSLEHTKQEASLVARPPRSVASGWRTLHGGAVALLAARGAHHVVGRTTTDAVRCLSLDAEFFRTVPSGTEVVITGSVVHQGRSYITAEGRVLLQDRRTAAVVRTTGALRRR